MKKVAPFENGMLEAICKVLAHTSDGLTGSEIGHLLRTCRITDTDAMATKWKRLFYALAHYQNRRQSGNHVVGFIHHAMKPVRWKDKRQQFDLILDELNKVLAFAGLEIRDDGGVRYTDTVSTLSEAEERANSLRAKLTSRGVHHDVLRFCQAELLQKNYFHSVLEATKSVANKIRDKSGLTGDGAQLATDAFSLGRTNTPVLAINSLQTETERGEQRGFANLLIGLFGTFRNPTAHAEKIYWTIPEQDALDILSLVSLVHRKLDNCVKTIS